MCRQGNRLSEYNRNVAIKNFANYLEVSKIYCQTLYNDNRYTLPYWNLWGKFYLGFWVWERKLYKALPRGVWGRGDEPHWVFRSSEIVFDAIQEVKTCLEQ